MAQSSKHEAHADLILAMVAAGRTYAGIVTALAERGCKTSKGEVHGWLQRRAERLAARASLINPVEMAIARAAGAGYRPPGSTLPPAPDTTAAEPVPRWAKYVDPDSPIAAFIRQGRVRGMTYGEIFRSLRESADMVAREVDDDEDEEAGEKSGRPTPAPAEPASQGPDHIPPALDGRIGPRAPTMRDEFFTRLQKQLDDSAGKGVGLLKPSEKDLKS